MATNPTLAAELRELYAKESARLKEEFAARREGSRFLAGRTELVDSVAQKAWTGIVSPDAEGPKDFALVALGGYGRRWLFPYSDIDLLFLHAGDKTEARIKEPIRRFSQELWDLRLRLSPASRTLGECERVDADNLEFAISLLDCRYLAGGRELFARLRESVIPKLVGRESQVFLTQLAELARSRHGKFGGTLFHLEPNVKDGPGGLRDYNVAHWLGLISALTKNRAWPEAQSLPPPLQRKKLEGALAFLMSVRCFLHFRHSRDDNVLAWDAQAEAAAASIGVPGGDVLTASDWMRIYFSHARSIYRACARVLSEIPAERPSLYRQFQTMRSRLSNAEFSVVDDMVSLRQPENLTDPQLVLRVFRFLARHGLSLSSVTEMQIEQALPSLGADPPEGSELWHVLQEILLGPHAADALRAMHSLGVLTILLPEFRGIDSLVVRDYSHRFTVDEHTFVAIENLHALRQSQSKWDQRYAELLEELEQPDLLYLAILLHDTGKGAKTDDHVSASLEIAGRALERLDLDALDREAVLFLVGRHLEMSAAMRRDIFDPDTVRAFAAKVETPERLKMLCLLTYADIKAVNPEALSPWKAENIWQLYIATANHLNRSLDQRFHMDAHDELLEHLRTLAPATGKHVESFLEGLPRRYLLTHAAGDVFAHADMAANLSKNPVQVDLRRGRHWYELILVTPDRPFLFASMAGILAAWGMNIVKASAFSNAAGVVVDTFYFTDTFRTLELNLSEWERFKVSIHDALVGKLDLERMLRDRLRAKQNRLPKVKVPTQIHFDDSCSAHSTLVEVVAQDQPGLLHRISSRFAHEKCNIEIALIDTEGQTAIDVFYLTSGGGKLAIEQQERLGAALVAELG
ncbi:MAG TPA: [protein-PII] uridylyltransferase [Candidatus Acidoferrum sp.]|nr:[protein-PII] uridylyltransferase [Candidatus Acidoferrum sp.]